MARTVSGFNDAAKGGIDEARKYCQAWQFEITKLNAMLVSEWTAKKITQPVYTMKREELNKQAEALNKCIAIVNTHPN